MITLSHEAKASIRKLVKSARKHGEKAAEISKEMEMEIDKIFESPICSKGKDKRTCMMAIAGYCCDKEEKK